MVDSFLVNTPVSSPLHPQLNLPLLKGYLGANGYSSTVIDCNIDFFNKFMGDCRPNLVDPAYLENPLQLLESYNNIEALLLERSQEFDQLGVGLRNLSMKYDRTMFGSVAAATHDELANPFISYFDQIISERILPASPKIVGIATTFQDQIIPTFTLASRIRLAAPRVKIVLGGQMITRCYESLFKSNHLRDLFDYLVLWDGEVPLLNIHRYEISSEDVVFTNVISRDGDLSNVNRRSESIPGKFLSFSPDFTDIDYNDYWFPEYLIPLQTTRGCYARCSFCAIPYGSNRYRVRDAVAVVDEIQSIQNETFERYGRRAVYFKFMEDTSAPSTLLEVSDLISERGLDVQWETFARLEKAFVAPGVMERLYAGGCRKIHWGLETSDPDILQEMNKKTEQSYTDEVLRLSGAAGILNFCFVLVGFPGETEKSREMLVDYIVGNEDIHTLTISSFDLTRNSPMDEEFEENNVYGLEREKAEEFQVRLPYRVKEKNWKKEIVKAAHHVLTEIVRRRPDIGFVTLFPDQVRGILCERYGNDWGRQFVNKYGKQNVREMLQNVEQYVENFAHNRTVDFHSLPEPLKREHLRIQEDLALLARAALRRKEYENRRIEQV